MIIVTNVVNRTKTEAEWKWGIPKYFFNKLTLYQIFLCPVKGIVFQYPGEVDALRHLLGGGLLYGKYGYYG